VTGKAKLGVQCFADGLLIIPKTLATNSGFDQMDTILSLLDEYATLNPTVTAPAGDTKRTFVPVGVDVSSGGAIDPAASNIWDVFRVKHQMVESAGVISSQILLVDEIMRAGRVSYKPGMAT